MQLVDKHREYNLKYYHDKRKKLIAQLGGRCVVCGSTEDLEFDHLDSTTKSFTICMKVQCGDAVLAPELAKCQLLCRSCHINKSKTSKDGNVRIDAETARAICNEYLSTDITQKELADKYKIAPSSVSGIIRGVRWVSETADIDRTAGVPRQSILKEPIAVDMIEPVSGAVVKTYDSISAAARDGHKAGAISKCCRGLINMHHGHQWRQHPSQ